MISSQQHYRRINSIDSYCTRMLRGQVRSELFYTSTLPHDDIQDYVLLFPAESTMKSTLSGAVAGNLLLASKLCLISFTLLLISNALSWTELTITLEVIS
jgi:hypothetical protein